MLEFVLAAIAVFFVFGFFGLAIGWWTLAAGAFLYWLSVIAGFATVTNVVPMNGQQDPIIGDTIYDNEVLWAYVTSPNGGVICPSSTTTTRMTPNQMLAFSPNCTLPITCALSATHAPVPSCGATPSSS